MYAELSNFVWSQDLPPTEKLVLLAIATAINHPGEECYKSEATFAKLTGLGKRSVIRAIMALVKRGILGIDKRHHKWTDEKGIHHKTKWLLNHYTIKTTSATVTHAVQSLVPQSPSTSAKSAINYSQGGTLVIPSNHPIESSKEQSISDGWAKPWVNIDDRPF